MPTKRIYLVDDNDLVRESLTVLIEMKGGLRVCGEAANADGALSGIRSHDPHVALVDLSLGDGVGGVKLISMLREEHPDLAIIALTGHAESSYKQSALEAGARRFIDKKNAIKALVPAIHEVLAPGA